MGRIASAEPLVIVLADDAEHGGIAAGIFAESGLHPLPCSDAEEALDALRSHGQRVALVFADLALQGRMSGLDLARKVPSRWPGTRVVLTGGEPPAAVPADIAFVPKPWRAVDLIVTAERAVGHLPTA